MELVYSGSVATHTYTEPVALLHPSFTPSLFPSVKVSFEKFRTLPPSYMADEDCDGDEESEEEEEEGEVLQSTLFYGLLDRFISVQPV